VGLSAFILHSALSLNHECEPVDGIVRVNIVNKSLFRSDEGEDKGGRLPQRSIHSYIFEINYHVSTVCRYNGVLISELPETELDKLGESSNEEVDGKIL
ncbi:13169_t:CDS:2, partial [Acaulospora morrowiae]